MCTKQRTIVNLWCSALNFIGKIKIFVYVNIFANLFQHMQLVDFSSSISLQSVFYFHEQEGKMGSYMKEKEMHLHLSQHKFLNVILKKN